MIRPDALVSMQNSDGGWGYRGGGGSWTEPTCYALMALDAWGLGSSGEASRGSGWISARQRADGGWAPRDGVDQSTWVTALVLLLGDSLFAPAQAQAASAWLRAQTGRESSLVYRLRMRLLGVRLDDPAVDGWPWFPGAAAWVVPTALSILALQKIAGRTKDRGVLERIELGRRFLLARRCRDGGWNHGSTKALGYDSDSYAETTGIALLALHGAAAPGLDRSEEVARQKLEKCFSLEGASWLRLALITRGVSAEITDQAPRGGTMEIALSLLAEAAARGRNIFIA
jgi:hypothetical protein